MLGMPDDNFYNGLDLRCHVSGVLLGFDFGTKRIGVAVGQTLLASANPLTPLLANDGIPNWSEIDDILDKWRPVGLVVGIPFYRDGTASETTFQARKFARRLKLHTKLPVFPMDETLSSQRAEAEIVAREGKGALKKYSVDSVAACLILEDWLQNVANCSTND